MLPANTSLKLALISVLMTSASASPLGKRQDPSPSVVQDAPNAPIITSNSTSLAAQLPDYSKFTKSAFVRFTSWKEGQPINGTPTLPVRFEEGWLKTESRKFHPVSMDSGSTGYTFNWSDVSDKVKANQSTYQEGFKFLSSSKRLSLGYWVPVKLEFDAGNGVSVWSDTFVLAVNKQVNNCKGQYYGTCTEFITPTTAAAAPTAVADTPSTDAPAVTPGPSPADSPELEINSVKRGLQPIEKRAYWGYMGVGVGREADGMQQSTPEKNPLINVFKIGDEEVNAENFRHGYILRDDGIEFGLTAENTKGFTSAQKLTMQQPPSAGNPNDKWDYPQSALDKNWGAPKMCITIRQKDAETAPQCVPGTWLVDTGLPSMYLTVPPESGAKTHEIPNPNNKNLKSQSLDDGQTIVVDVEGAGHVEITVGSDHPEEPSVVLTTVTTPDKKKPWANVGRNLLRTHDVLWDVAKEGGYYSMKVRDTAASGAAAGSGGSTPAPVSGTTTPGVSGSLGAAPGAIPETSPDPAVDA